MHTGECEIGGRGLGGVPVRIAAGVAAAAAPGEVLVSSVVRDLVAGSGLSFHERAGLAAGAARWPLYALDR